VNRGAFHCSKTEIEKHFQGYTRRMELFERFGLNLDWARRVLKKTTCFLPLQKPHPSPGPTLDFFWFLFFFIRRVLKKTTCFLPFQKQTNFPTAVALVLSP